ncbi:hypothetical protein BCR35DRAFT_355386 [Leucosporidium creatinivorum]|uniref:RRN6 K-rich C-terminal domain-containing protein n=1 Tax=Leucosporidium creatinivorum TaxID=106004 RepID=A0A1Y2DHH3_9BASI|nr:hypothetical protein BCR35DRAFT_355386 [Leucosporidium creatinivorum]
MPQQPSRQSCIACAQLELNGTPCDGQYPCTSCTRTSIPCAYPQPPPFSSAWTTRELDKVETWSEPLYLAQGTTGSARLSTTLNKDGEVKRVEWQAAVGQQQDLRIRPRASEPTHLLFPPTITGEHEHETVDELGDRLTFARDNELMDNYTYLAPTDLLPPTILLNAALADRPPRTSHRIRTAFQPWNLNFGNCMSIVSLPTSDGTQSSTFAAWRRGDESGRGTSVGWGSFTSPEEDPEELPSASDPSFSRRVPLLSPLAPPIARTISPILQLQLAPLASSSSLLAIRTQTELKLLHLGLDSPHPSSLAAFDYNGFERGRRPIADVALGGIAPHHGEAGSGMVVDVDGGLFGWGLGARGSGRVGDPGGDWKGGKPEMFRLRKGRKKGVMGYGGFARVGYGGGRGSDAVVALEDEVLLYDLRSPTSSTTLVTPDLLSRHIPYGQTGPSLLTSLLTRSPNSSSPPTSHHLFSTTRDLLFIDDRMPNKELFRWAHNRVGKEGKGVDRTLSLIEIPSPSPDPDPDHGHGQAEAPHRVALHSRIHPLITIYTHSSSPTEPPRSLLDPFSLPSPTKATTTDQPFVRAGLAVLPLPSLARLTGEKGKNRKEEESWIVAEVGNDGAVFQRVCSTAEGEGEEEEEGAGGGRVVQQWSEEVERVRVEIAVRRQEGIDGGAVGGKEKAETTLLDASKVRRALKVRTVEDEEGRDVERALEERVKRAVQLNKRAREEDEGGEVGVLTAQELLTFAEHDRDEAREDSMDLNDETKPEFSLASLPPLPRPSTFTDPSRPSTRSIPLATSASHLQDLAIALSDTAGFSSTHFEPRPNHVQSGNQRLAYAPDLPTSFLDMPRQADVLKSRYGAVVDSDEDEETSLVRRAMANASEEVALDLALSAHVVSSTAVEPNPPPTLINAPHPPDQSPPPLHFTYFRPRRHINGRIVDDSDASDDDDETSNWKKPSLNSVGVRALLSEWHVGSNPQSYAWSNPYADEQQKDDPFSQSQSTKAGKRRQKQRERSSVAPNLGPSSQAFSQSQATTFGFPSSFPAPSSQAPPPFATSPAATPQRLRIPTILEQAPSSPSAPTFAASQPQPLGFGFGAGSSSSFGSQDLRTPSAFGPAASQILPGAFGGREREKKEKDKKKGKKRVSGF